MFPLADFTRIIEINLIGTFNVIRLAAERIGRLDPASKGGVVGMTLPIARDLASAQIRVMTIAPGCSTHRCSRGRRTRCGPRSAHKRRTPPGWEIPRSMRRSWRTLWANPMRDGEVIRLDGAIRMAPR